MEPIEEQWTISRRRFFGVSGCSGTILASTLAGSKRLCGNELQSGVLQHRKQQAFDIRNNAARKYPYISSKTQFGDITFGSKNVLSMIAQAALCGQKCSYYHKWLVHRRPRPEVFGGQVENHLSGRKTYDIHSDILISEAVGRVFSAYGSRLLPVAYPEGSPTHPLVSVCSRGKRRSVRHDS